METIVLGYSDTEAAKAARRWAIEEAQRRSAEVLLVYVLSSVWEWEAAVAQVNTDPVRHELTRRLHKEWSEPLRAAGVPHRSELLLGRPAEAIMQCARRESASLIVVGMSTRGSMSELLLGSAAHRLMREAHRPVVAVPADWQPPVD